MAKVIDVVSGALKLLTVRVAESPITTSEAEDGLLSLNDMMAELEEDEISIGYEALDDVQDTLYVNNSAIGPIKALLAVYIAPEYSRPVSVELSNRADRARKSLRASIVLNESEYPDSLPRGSGNEVPNGTGDGDVPGGNWGRRFYSGNLNKKCN